MKKIFAIALALVMVLSMASAFAFVGTCGDYAYTCPTVGCGVAKAEVVQFAANNTIDYFEETNCAAVVYGMPVFFGVKVNFDASVNSQWYDHADTKLEVAVSNATNTVLAWDNTNVNFTGLKTLKSMVGATSTAADVSTNSYWLAVDGTDWKLTKTFDPATCVFGATASNTRVEVCANVKYDFNGLKSDLGEDWIKYGNFEVMVQAGADTASAKFADYVVTVKKGADTLTIAVVGGVAKYATFGSFATAGTIYYDMNGTTVEAKGTIAADGTASLSTTSTTSLDCAKVDDLMALIHIGFGDCVNADVIKAIFGWDDADKFMSCKTWNKDAKAIVNAECVVMGIPKTGDKSVLAWMF